MFLKHSITGKMVEVLSLRDLFNPMHETVIGRYHYGEEAQDPESFDKAELSFCSNETIPKCWTDPHYRDDEVMRHYKAPV
ncbi:acetyltransferase [uncultured Thiodictyon sp.]|uniref:acetyltransferase n=1 Tax=uncultured Thiodictyon sp. TaxID=1846217 RepID=UPI0025D1D5FD|nr:acetyltransferase [uncultured Thiodictyon sp.]